jgi:hypothetical protein
MTAAEHAAPAAPAPTTGPRLAWLGLGVAVALLAAAWAVALSVTRDEPEPDASRTGPGAVTIQVAKDSSYGVYLPAGEAPEFAASLSCRIAAGGGAASSLVVDEWGGGYDGPERTEFGRSWDAVGVFTSPVSGSVSVSCDDAASGLLVRPADDALLGVGGPFVAAVLLSLAGAALAIAVGVARARGRRTGGGGPGDAFYLPDKAGEPRAPYNPPPPVERGPGLQQGPW